LESEVEAYCREEQIIKTLNDLISRYSEEFKTAKGDNNWEKAWYAEYDLTPIILKRRASHRKADDLIYL